jgi:hypothetical protein
VVPLTRIGLDIPYAWAKLKMVRSGDEITYHSVRRWPRCVLRSRLTLRVGSGRTHAAGALAHRPMGRPYPARPGGHGGCRLHTNRGCCVPRRSLSSTMTCRMPAGSDLPASACVHGSHPGCEPDSAGLPWSGEDSLWIGHRPSIEHDAGDLGAGDGDEITLDRNTS